MSNHPFNSRKADIPNPSMVNFPFSNGYRISYFGPRNVVTFYEKHPLWDQEPLFKKCAKIIRDYFSRRLLFCIFFEVTIKIYIYTSGIYYIYITLSHYFMFSSFFFASPWQRCQSQPNVSQKLTFYVSPSHHSL